MFTSEKVEILTRYLNEYVDEGNEPFSWSTERFLEWYGPTYNQKFRESMIKSFMNFISEWNAKLGMILEIKKLPGLVESFVQLKIQRSESKSRRGEYSLSFEPVVKGYYLSKSEIFFNSDELEEVLKVLIRSRQMLDSNGMNVLAAS